MVSISASLGSLDIDLDIGLIVTSLAPSILIIVTYYFSKKERVRYHNHTIEKLNGQKEVEETNGEV